LDRERIGSKDSRRVTGLKAGQDESKIFSDAIDRINQGMEDIINLYNELEEDRELINFDDDIAARIVKAKEKYGGEFVDQKINNVVKEIIEWLPLDGE
jgi:hypothetical protein